jgi:hypothetical protein
MVKMKKKNQRQKRKQRRLKCLEKQIEEPREQDPNCPYMLIYDISEDHFSIFGEKRDCYVKSHDFFQAMSLAREKGILPDSPINNWEVYIRLQDRGRKLDSSMLKFPILNRYTIEDPLRDSFVLMHNGYITTSGIERYKGNLTE